MSCVCMPSFVRLAVLPMMAVLLTSLCHASATHEVLWASPACSLPEEKSGGKQISSWRHISCHTDKNRYYTWSQPKGREGMIHPNDNHIIGIALAKHIAHTIIVKQIKKQNAQTECTWIQMSHIHTPSAMYCWQLPTIKLPLEKYCYG